MENPELVRIIELVESLYKPNNDPQSIRTAQFRLQRIQKSSDGWELANRLLQTSSPNCQFFGALTFTVKLNGVDVDKPDIDPNQVINQLSYWLASVKNRNFKPFVVTKILSTLSTFFIKFPQYWPDCILSVIIIIGTGEPVAKFDNPSNEIVSQLLTQLSAEDLILVLKFCKALVDDFRSASLTDVKISQVQEILLNNLTYFIQLVHISFKGLESISFNNINDKASELLIKTLETTASWIEHFNKVTLAERELKQFTSVFLNYLEISYTNNNEPIFLSTIDLVVDMFTSNKNVWERSNKERLYQFIMKAGAIITSEIQQGQNENNEEEYDGLNDCNISFCRLLLTFGENYTVDYLEDPQSESSIPFKTLLEYIISFSNLSAIPIVEDTMSMEILEFWNNFVEEIVGGGALSSEPQTNYIARVIGIYWHRIMLPTDKITQSWNKDNWQEFLTFRRDFCDFLELAYPIVSSELFKLLVNSVIENINQRPNMNWRQIECSLYCLNGLSDMIGTSGEEYSTVQSVFSSSLWEDLSSCNNLKVRQTAVNLIGSFDGFFETTSGQPYLSPTLSFLFESLSIPHLSLTASRSIQKLCASCRKHLVQLLPNFIDLYITQQYYSTTNSTAHERTVYAIACVVQALDRLEDKLEYIDKLVSILVDQLYVIIQKSHETVVEVEVVEQAVSLLKSIANIGKGLRIPEETTNISKEQLDSISLFWETYGTNIRQKILQIIQAFTIDNEPFNMDPQISDVCCEIIKTGFSEIVVNPFVFSPDTVLTFLSAKHRFGPQACYSTLVGLASCLVTSSSFGDSELASHYISALLETFFGSNNHYNEYEPDIQVGNLQLLTQIFNHYPDSFLSNPSGLAFMIGFTTEMLSSQDRFVIRAASKFWTAFITKDKSKGEDSQARKLEVIKSAGPAIVIRLVAKISGDAARSDLEYFTDIIKKLVNKYPLESKPWFIDCILNSPQGSLAQRDETLRTRFITKLFNVRGGRETNVIVKNFWSDCKGIANYT